MEGLSWGQILFTVVAAAAAPWIAALLKAKRTSFLKIYSFCVLVATPLTYFTFIFPKSGISAERCWIPIGEYCLPLPWVLLIGFALGSFAALILWFLIKSPH